MPETAFEICIEIAHWHVFRLGARTPDSLLVASAIELRADRFWTFDNRSIRVGQSGRIETNLAHSYSVARRNSAIL